MPDLVNHRPRGRHSLAALALVLSSAVATAAPLDAEQCAALNAKITALDQTGVKQMLENGLAAAKATLTKEKRDQVASYLDALGALRFRCPNAAPFVTLKPEPPEDPAEVVAITAPIDANAPGITLPPGVTAALVAPVVPKKPVVAKQPKAAASPPVGKVVAPTSTKPKAQVAAQPAGKPADPTAPVVASPPKPKPKSDDAFKPAVPSAAQPKAP